MCISHGTLLFHSDHHAAQLPGEYHGGMCAADLRFIGILYDYYLARSVVYIVRIQAR